MGFKIVRKPFKIGSSTAITLPADWCEYYREKIQTITIIGSSLLILAPAGLEQLADKLIKEMEAPNV
jgi:hypothetical protein